MHLPCPKINVKSSIVLYDMKLLCVFNEQDRVILKVAPVGFQSATVQRQDAEQSVNRD